MHCFERGIVSFRPIAVPSSPVSPPSDRLAVAAHLHVALRRKLGRVTDTEWMASNRDYARAMLELCRQQDDAALLALAERLYGLWAEAPPVAVSAPVASPHKPAVPAPPRALAAVTPAPALGDPTAARQALERRYIGRLR